MIHKFDGRFTGEGIIHVNGETADYTEDLVCGGYTRVFMTFEELGHSVVYNKNEESLKIEVKGSNDLETLARAFEYIGRRLKAVIKYDETVGKIEKDLCDIPF